MAPGVMIQPPKTMMEVYKNLPEGTHVQLIENKLIMSPAPVDKHQVLLLEISADILFHLRQNKIGEIRISPYDVYLDGNNAFQPDILFVLNENLMKIKKNGLYGSPDLVIEILSPTNAWYDKTEKKEVYARCGVSEYWLIDPQDNSSIGYTLTKNGYQEFFQGNGILESKLLELKIRF